MNKIFAVLLSISSLMMVGCDRNTLNGLNLKINGEINSSYDNEVKETQSSEESVSQTKTKAQVKETVSEESSAKVEKKESVKQVNQTENDPDAPMAFKEIAECSKAGITAKTNEIFYADNPQVKSIDSKNQKQVKEWERIYAEVEQKCQ